MAEKSSSNYKDPFSIPFENLPQKLPIFPLPGAMLLPHGKMPLNIFEPRYLKMVFDSLKGSRLIGMVQPLELLPDPVPEKTDLFDIGCAGRITSFTESEDGRILLTLQGVCRFEIEKEFNTTTAYRQVKPNFAAFKDDLLSEYPAVNREGLIPVLRDYLELKGLNINWADLDKIEDRFLIATIGMINPFDYKEKQAILQTQNIRDIAHVMISLMEMELASIGQSPTKH